MPSIRKLVPIVSTFLVLACSLISIAELPTPNNLLKVVVSTPFTPNPAFVGQPVKAGFSLFFTKNTLHEEAQKKGIAKQTLTLQYKGGEGFISSVTLTGVVVKPGGVTKEFRLTIKDLLPGQTQEFPAYNLSATFSSTGDELVVKNTKDSKSSPVINQVQTEGFFLTGGAKEILLNAAVEPEQAKEPAIGEGIAKGQLEADKAKVGYFFVQVLQADPNFKIADANPVINRIIYSNSVKMKFALPSKFVAGLPKGTTFEWDFGSGVFGQSPAEKAAANKGEYTLQYSPEKDADDNIQLTENAANRRKVFNIRVQVTIPGLPAKIFERPIRVALKSPKILNDIPANVIPSDPKYDPAQAQAFLNAYKYDEITPKGAWTWSDFKDLGAKDRADFDTDIGGKAQENLMQAFRLLIGRDRKETDPVAATLIAFNDPNKDLQFPNAKLIGSVIFGGKLQVAFKWDKPEVSYIVEHERNQLRSGEKLKTGGDPWGLILAAYFLRGDLKDAAAANLVWNPIERELEDLQRVAAAQKNPAKEPSGDVSWNFYETRAPIFWLAYSKAVFGDKSTPGSLLNIKDLEGQGKLPAGTYKTAYNEVAAVYKAITALGPDWADLPLNLNGDLSDVPPGQASLIYWFADPATPALKLPMP
jgi:hypothetical protein